MRFLRSGQTVDDPLAAALAAHDAQHGTVLGFEPVFGTLGGDARVQQAVRRAAESLDRSGPLAAATQALQGGW